MGALSYSYSAQDVSWWPYLLTSKIIYAISSCCEPTVSCPCSRSLLRVANYGNFKRSSEPPLRLGRCEGAHEPATECRRIRGEPASRSQICESDRHIIANPIVCVGTATFWPTLAAKRGR
jgi:hypothetical protein